MLTTNHTTPLHVLETGSGPLTLVFLHYFGGSSLEWQAVMGLLAADYRCLAVDLPGHGDSAEATEGYSVDNMADAVMAVLQAKGVTGDFALVGHSMGGKVVLTLASRQPAGLRALLLLAPSPPTPEPIPEADRQEMLATHGQRSAAEKTFANITVVPLPESARAQIIADNLRTAGSAWRAWLTGGSNEDISDRMAAIEVPVAILAGADDHPLPPTVQSDHTVPYLKNATFDTVEAAGHLLPWEAPDTVAAFIRTKLNLL